MEFIETHNEQPREELDKLNVRYYIKFSQLNDNFSFLPAEQYTMTCEIIHKAFAREYALLDGEQGISIDEEIARLQIERDKRLEAVRVEREAVLREIEEAKRETEKLKKEAELKHKAELENFTKEAEIQHEAELRNLEIQRLNFKQEEERLKKELEDSHNAMLAELELEAERHEAEIERKRAKQNDEFEILLQTVVQEMRIKTNSIIPDYRHRFKLGKWEFGRLIPNQAMRLALQTANLDIQEYLADRETSIAEKRDNLLRKLGLEPDEEPGEELIALSKKEWLQLFKRISKLPADVASGIETDLQEQVSAAELQKLKEDKCAPMSEEAERLILEEMEAERIAQEKAERAAEKAKRRAKRKNRNAVKQPPEEANRETDGSNGANASGEPQNAPQATGRRGGEEEPAETNEPAEGEETHGESG